MTDLKFAMLLALITRAAEDQAHEQEKGAVTTRVIDTSFVHALCHPDLALAMHLQLDTGFLERNCQLFTGEIVFEGTIFRIMGTYDQWRAFFCGMWDLLIGWEGRLMSHN